MAEAVTKPKSVLDGVALTATPDLAAVTEARIAARINLRTSPATVARLLQWSAIALPERINTARTTGAWSVIQLGPDEWLILCEDQPAHAIAQAIATSSGGVAHSLVDITDRMTGLTLTGPAVEDVLAACCPLPLSLAAFPAGRATRTLFAKAEVVLWRQALDRFHIEVGRSFAPYLAGLLATVIREEAAIRRS